MTHSLIETLETTLKIALLAAALSSVTARAADLKVSIAEVREARGPLMLNVLTSEEQMAGKADAYSSIILPARVSGVSFTLHDLPAGTYGIQVMQDVNGNGKLDSNMIGIPKEPWAFSNNAAGRFGPPTWKDVQFTIEADTDRVEQTINLIH